MSEEPKDLLPATTPGEGALDAFAAVVAMVPLLGGPISAILSGLSLDMKVERMKEVLEGIAEEIEQLGAESEEYVRQQDFQALFEQTLRRVGDEPRAAKRNLYGQFLAQAIRNPRSYDERIQMLQTLDVVQPVHISCLEALRDAPHRTMRIPGERVAHWDDLYKATGLPIAEAHERFEELERFGLVGDASRNSGQLRPGGLDPLLSPYGVRFLQFLLGQEESEVSD